MKEVYKQSLLQGRKVRLMFQDEGRCVRIWIHRRRINHPKRCWAPPGIRPESSAQLVREYMYVYAAVSPHDGVLDSLILPEVNAEAMSIFLEEVSNRHAEDFIIMVLDGAGWHRDKALKVPSNMKLIPLPPYSPQLNPIENIREEIREKWFSNKVFRDLDSVIDTLTEALLSLENDTKRVHKIAGFK